MIASASHRLAPSVARRPVVAEDLFELRFLMGADLAADGRTVVYAVSRSSLAENRDYIELFVLDVASGAMRRLIDDPAVLGSPAFSPDGQSIAFLSMSTGVSQIHVIPAAGGEVRAITSLPRGVGGGPVWSPDGKRIAFSAGPQGEPRDPNKPYRVSRTVWRADGMGLLDDVVQDIYVVDVDAGEVRRLTNDAAMNVNPVWSADGASLIYSASFDPRSAPMATHLRLVTLDGAITDLANSGFLVSHAALPDGRIAYVLGFEFGRLPGTKGDLWVLDPRTGKSERRAAGLDVGVGGLVMSDMLSFGMSIGKLAISRDGRHAFAQVQRGGESSIYKFALSGPEAYELVVGGERVNAPVRLCGDQLLFASFGLAEPGDLFVFDTSRGEEKRLTHLNAEFMEMLELPQARRLNFKSRDGVAVEGWFLPPASGSAPHPTVLALHGGPHAGWGHAFNFDFLALSGAGFGVLFLNQRGSTGYGDSFATIIHADWGNLDYADVMAGVDHAIELGLADADRLGVCGLPAGGFMTGWIITHSHRFKAACPENPGFNWFSNYGTSDTGMWGGPAMLGGQPYECPEVYHRSSPVYYAHLCKTPTLLLQHEQDHRTPPEQSEQFYAILKSNGVTVEMLRFPNTGHAGSLVGPPSHRHAQNEALLDWMTRYVLGAGEQQ